LTQRSHPNSNHLTTPIDIGTDWLVDLSADRRQSLRKLKRNQTVNWQPLMIQPLQLLQLTRF
jgi:hypothetical protein